jgi:hypothetical protein
MVDMMKTSLPQFRLERRDGKQPEVEANINIDKE